MALRGYDKRPLQFLEIKIIFNGLTLFRVGGGAKLPPLSNFFNFLKIVNSYSPDVLGLLVFILWPHFRQFSCIYTSLTKSYEHFVTSTRIFSNIFNFLLTSALSYIHCCNFFISTTSCYILFIYFPRRKEVHPGF